MPTTINTPASNRPLAAGPSPSPSGCCPLCGGTDVQLREAIPIPLLNDLYELSFGVREAVKSAALAYLGCATCDLHYFSPAGTGGPELYERLQQFEWYYMSDKAEYRIARRHISERGGVLEVGAGRGAFAAFVGKERYTGLEFNEPAIASARAAGINLVNETVERHVQRGNRYAAVTAFQVLEHVASPATFIRACVECLQPGGTLILAVPSRDGCFGRFINDLLNMPPHHVTRWSETTLHKLSGLFGLRAVAIEHEPVADYHRAAARKALLESRLRRYLGMAERVLDRRLSAQLVSRCAAKASRLLDVPLDGVKGHTVVACYRAEQ